jgi:hypothetical protein
MVNNLNIIILYLQNKLFIQIYQPMLRFANIKDNPEKMLSLTTLTLKEFDELLYSFSDVWTYKMQYFNFDGSERQRAYCEKENAVLKTVEDKLFFIIYFLKNNPIQQALAENFGMSQPQANTYIHFYKKILHEALEKQDCLPERNINKFKQRLSKNKKLEFYCDGTERSIPRSTDYETQKENFSGKKHAHCKKNNVIINSQCKVEYLTDTYDGSTHDKKINDEEIMVFPDKSKVFADSGFQGYKPEGKEIELIIPKKKTKGKELTAEEKEKNKKISQVRVKIEHANSGIKRLRIVKDRIRVWKDNFFDFVMEIACALHNFRLKFRPWSYPESEKILQS